MILDNELKFAEAWAPTVQGVNISTNVLDIGPLTGVGSGGTNTNRDLGMGTQLWIEILVQTTVTSAGAATVDFQFRTSANANLTSSPTTLITTGAIAKATLVAGYVKRLQVPSDTGYLRYVGFNAQIATADLTAGAFQIKILKDIQSNVKYASGFGLDS